MSLRLRFERLRESYWFVPTLLTAAAILASFVTLTLDGTLAAGSSERMALPYAGGAEGARALLSTVAGSMITVAGVTFSITMVALTLTSSQFGPRLLVNFMRDRGNQLVLGTFLATFVFCLLVLRAVRGPGEVVFVPQISISFALLLALASIGVLIYFIHHAAIGIRAEKIIADVGAELDVAIDAFAAPVGDPAADGPARDAGDRTPVERDGAPIPAPDNGYVQAIDERVLVRLATEHDVAIALSRRPGHFVVAGEEIGRVHPPGRVDGRGLDAIAACCCVGATRTLEQDLEFAVNQLVEVALRALSPGINDPFTAIACVDRLSASLVRLARKDLPPPVRRDEAGAIRLFVCPLSLRGVIDAAFDQLRQTARENVAVTIRLLESLRRIVGATGDSDTREALLRQTSMIERAVRRTAVADLDREEITRLCASVRESAGEAGRA